MGHEHRNKLSASFTEKTQSKKAVSRENIIQKLGLFANGRADHFHDFHTELEPLGADHAGVYLYLPFQFVLPSNSRTLCLIISVILPIPPAECFQVTNSPRVARVSRKVMYAWKMGWKISAYSPGSNVHAFDRGCKPTRPHAAQRL